MGPAPSPENNASAPTAQVAASTSALKQPTYTTAGTIYNPNSSQPLQPPARRGRSAKWNGVGVGQPDLVLFPKGVLAGLALKASPSVRAAAMPQYAPLQQNSDRAVSPLSGSDHAAVGITLSSQVPRMRSGNVPGQSFSLASKDDKSDTRGAEKAKENIAVAEEHTDVAGDDKQEDGGEDDHSIIVRLLAMNVKSISNLASYPNPIQKQAQKILSAGSRASLLGRRPPVSPVGPSGLTPAMEPRPEDPAGSLGRRGSGLLRPSQVGVTAKVVRAQTGLLPTARPPSPTLSGEKVATPSTVLFSRSGAPVPLTAGPPGQRHYRRSTLEPTLKAFGTVALMNSDVLREDEDGFLTDKTSPAHLGADDIDSLDPDILSSPFSLGSALSPICAASSLAAVGGEAEGSAGPKSLLAQLVEASEPDAGRAHESTPASSSYSDMTEWDQALDMSYHSWRFRDGSNFHRYMPNSTRLSAQAARARQEKIDSCWYAGSSLLGKWPEEIMAESKSRKLRCAYGVIGDGRPKKNPKTEYRHISVEEANATPISECAKPLLNMALAAVDRAQHEGLGAAFFEWTDRMREAAEAAEGKEEGEATATAREASEAME